MAESERSEDVSWRVALQVWWASAWRTVLLSVVLVMLITIMIVLLKRTLFSSRPEFVKVAIELGKGAIALIVFVVQVWATRRSLKIRYPSFSIIITHKVPL